MTTPLPPVSYTVTDTITGQTVAVSDLDALPGHLARWFVNPPDEVHAVIGDLTDKLRTGQPIDGEAAYLQVDVVSEMRRC